ncbi:MAG: DUF6502 family protein [Hyphomicrobiales bacterium]
MNADPQLPPAAPGGPHPALLRALRGLLKPLARVLIARGVTFPSFIRLAKAVYVEVAERDFPVRGKAQTDSRIHLLTGVHRKDIRALRAPALRHGAEAVRPSRDARLIALWTGSPDYLDGEGSPMALPRQKSADGGPSFEGLVETVTTDIRARAVLDEWMRRGLVRLDEAGMVHLDAAATEPDETFGEIAYYFGRNLRDHAAASAHNLLAETPPMLERAVYYEKLTAPSAEELATLARSLGSDVLVRVNRKAFELARQDREKPGADRRISFGMYFFSGPGEDGSTEGGP